MFNPYQSYMQKQAMNMAWLKNVKFSVKPNQEWIDEAGNALEHQFELASKRHTTDGKPFALAEDGTHNGRNMMVGDIQHINMPNSYQNAKVPERTASIGWIAKDEAKDRPRAIREGIGDRFNEKLIGHLMRGLKEKGFKHLMGDSGGSYSAMGEEFTKSLANKARDMGVNVKEIEMTKNPMDKARRENAHTIATMNTPVINIDEFFAAHKQRRMVNRTAQTAAPVNDATAHLPAPADRKAWKMTEAEQPATRQVAQWNGGQMTRVEKRVPATQIGKSKFQNARF